jgi:hypothetical protein
MIDDIAIIDIEASGLHFESYPIEIAILKYDRCRSWLIKPEASWRYWCDTAESMHGISRDTLMTKGLSAKDVANQLIVFLNDFYGVLYSDADRWDQDWINTLYFTVNQTCPFHIASIYDLLSLDDVQRFDELKAELAVSGRFRQHRARDDVLMISEAFKAVSRQ